jgi:hypothetical protein
MIERLISRFRKPDRLPATHVLSAAERDGIVLPLIEAHLAPLGFQKRRDRSWVNSDAPPIRPILQVMLWKGAAMSLRWGVSLDFVPHFVSGDLKWHRTHAAARADLWQDDQSRDYTMSYLRGPDHLRDTARTALPRAFERAQAFWTMAQDIDALPKLAAQIEAEAETEQSRDFGFSLTPQRQLARAFCMARAGEDQAARAQLDVYCDGQNLAAPVRDALYSALEAVRD